jgi:integrase
MSINIRFRAERNHWQIQWKDAAGHKLFDHAKTEAEAIAMKSAMERALAATPPPAASEPTSTPKAGTLGAYLVDWLRDVIEPHREAATYKSYDQQVRLFIEPKIGHVKLADLGRKKVREFLEDLYHDGVKLGRRRLVHACLRSACSSAVSDELVPSNPCEKLGRLLRHKDEQDADPEPNPYTREQAQTFLTYVSEHEARVWSVYFQFLHDTGCRVGELAALKWYDKNGKPLVDLVGKRAKIEASYSPAAGKDKLPKTNQRRYVDLTDLVVDLLTEWKKEQRERLMRVGLNAKTAYMVTNDHGSPRRQDGNLVRVFTRVNKGCGFVGHTPHDFRATFATVHLTDDFGRLPWVSRQLGHASERTTLDHYFRFLPTKTSANYANEIRHGR